MGRWSKGLSLFLALSLLVLIAGTESYAMMLKIPLEQLTQEADLIILGQVKSVQVKSIEGEEIEKGIFSLATILPEGVIKGRLTNPAVVVRFQGGAVGGKRLYIEDSPGYRVGEKIVVFLKKIVGKDYYQTVGLFQGKFLIKEDIIVREKVSVKNFLQQIKGLLRHYKITQESPSLE